MYKRIRIITYPFKSVSDIRAFKQSEKGMKFIMIIIDKKDYDAIVKINDRDIKCYSKKKIKNLYPDGNYSIIGETLEKNKKKEKNTIIIANKTFIVSKYGANSNIIYKRKGYFEVGDNEYIVYLKSRIAFLLILFFVLLGIAISVYFGIKIFTEIPSVFFFLFIFF